MRSRGSQRAALRVICSRTEVDDPSSRPEFATDGKRFFFTITIGTRQSDIWAMELRTQR